MSTETPEQYSYSIRHDRFHAGLIQILIFGLYTSIVLSTLHELVIKKGPRALVRPLIVLMLVMYACAMVLIVTLWRFLQHVFVDSATSTDATLDRLAKSSVSALVVGIVTRGLLMLIGDGIMVWRCWGLYGGSWAVIGLPLLLTLGEGAVLLARIVLQVKEGFHVEGTGTIGLLRIAHHSVTLATTVLTTALIVYRIVRMGGFKRYVNIIAIVVEFAALYSCVLIIYMPFPFHPVLWDTIPYAVLVFIPSIASTLIISRVTLDRGIEHTIHEKTTYADGPPAREASIRFHHSTLRTETGTGVSSSGIRTQSQSLAGSHVVENGRHGQEHSETRATA